jgi:ubiquinone/menaquinone biosynthesis C-methylase UbiE
MTETVKLAYAGVRVQPGAQATRRKPYIGLAMEGSIARRYARETGGDLARFRAIVDEIAGRVAPGSAILEVAPGPGYLAVELARSSTVTGLDISRTFVEIAAANAAAAGVEADFRVGDAAAMPLPSDSFDLVVCCAAFKNFREPVEALCEMHRVLKPGGLALIHDMRRDASNSAIEEEVRSLKLSRTGRLMTRWIFKYSLRPRAYALDAFRTLVAATPFGTCTIDEAPLGFAAWLTKPPA